MTRRIVPEITPEEAELAAEQWDSLVRREMQAQIDLIRRRKPLPAVPEEAEHEYSD